MSDTTARADQLCWVPPVGDEYLVERANGNSVGKNVVLGGVDEDHPPLPPAQYYASLPKQIASAGVILHDGPNRILLVRPSYRQDTWEIPGGGTEAGEYPWQTARREVKEELGLDLIPGRLLAVDWVPPGSDGRPALANFVFDGGPLTQTQAEQHLRLDPQELSEWRLTAAQEWGELLLPPMARRLRACADALATGTTAYLQHGWHPTNPD